MTASASRAKCHAGARPLERRVRAHLFLLRQEGGYVARRTRQIGKLPLDKPIREVGKQRYDDPAPEGRT